MVLNVPKYIFKKCTLLRNSFKVMARMVPIVYAIILSCIICFSIQQTAEPMNDQLNSNDLSKKNVRKGITEMSRIHPSYINQLTIAAVGFEEKDWTEYIIADKLGKIILSAVQLSLLNHLTNGKWEKRQEVEKMDSGDNFLWEMSDAETLSNVQNRRDNTDNNNVKEKNKPESASKQFNSDFEIDKKHPNFDVQIVGQAEREGTTSIYYVVMFRNSTILADIITKDLSYLTLSHISAYLGLPIIGISNLGKPLSSDNDSQNWWIVVLCFGFGLILFFFCWCLLFVYFNTCGKIRIVSSPTSPQKTNDLSHSKSIDEVSVDSLTDESISSVDSDPKLITTNVKKDNLKKYPDYKKTEKCESLHGLKNDRNISKINLFEKEPCNSLKAKQLITTNSNGKISQNLSIQMENNNLNIDGEFELTDNDSLAVFEKNNEFSQIYIDSQFNQSASQLSQNYIQAQLRQNKSRPQTAKSRKPAREGTKEFYSIAQNNLNKIENCINTSNTNNIPNILNTDNIPNTLNTDNIPNTLNTDNIPNTLSEVTPATPNSWNHYEAGDYLAKYFGVDLGSRK